MNSMEVQVLTVPVGKEIRGLAMQFAAEQATAQKGKQVYLNTLAVYAVHRYLKWLHVETDLSHGDCWHPGKRSLFDLADLVIPNIGKLECRPVLPQATVCWVPEAARSDRIGYLFVQFSDCLETVQLLGFTTSVATGQVSIGELRSLDDFISHLNQLLAQSKIPNLQSEINLSQWLHNIFTESWQSIEEIFANRSLSLAFRDADRRGKLIDLAGHTVAIVVTLKPENSQKLRIRLRVYPVSDRIYLPPEIKLTILTETGEVFREVTARSNDEFIQYEFSGQRGEQFSVRITLGEVSFAESFVI
ncbi:hypothetical protein MiSe_26160 [Microseira wollei NIES-4236]|uniref:DUF1822 family protein n=2 Tax=Microseira wollei TaxID=467598 RepID=A0AAV3X4W8_9CYAN|nr:hypothetical protein MiSe_26160 [Microseira wollei NIES-4236]